MGQGNQKCFDLYAGKVGGQRENAFQNGPTLNQAAGAGLAFLVALLVLQNLLRFQAADLRTFSRSSLRVGCNFSFMSGTSFLWKYS